MGAAVDWNSLWRVGGWDVGVGPGWFRFGSRSRGGRRTQRSYNKGREPCPGSCQSSSCLAAHVQEPAYLTYPLQPPDDGGLDEPSPDLLLISPLR